MTEDYKFQRLGYSIGNLVDEKQAAYGDSYGKSGRVLEVLYPNGVRVDQYPTFLALTRVIDKLFRVATKRDAFGESPWRDIAGYALLGLAADEKPSTSSEKSFEIEQHLQDFAREYGIPIEVPAPDVDPMGMRIIRNSDRCCDHPERGICQPDLAPCELDPCDQPRYEPIEEVTR